MVRTFTATITFGVVRRAVVGTTATRLPFTHPPISPPPGVLVTTSASELPRDRAPIDERPHAMPNAPTTGLCRC